MGHAVENRVAKLLTQAYPKGDALGTNRFECMRKDDRTYEVWDHCLVFKVALPAALLWCREFDLVGWYNKQHRRMLEELLRLVALNLNVNLRRWRDAYITLHVLCHFWKLRGICVQSR